MTVGDVIEPTRRESTGQLVRVVTAGSVDDGKSTLIGQLLVQTQALFVDQLAALQAASQRRGQASPDLSLVTDGLKAEREQGITIDVAYRAFATARRSFILADCPGHEQYTRNMVTGASTADIAVILVDALRGVTTQSKRHAFIASLLGIPRAVVAVNKMDLVGFDQDHYRRIVDAFSLHGARLNIALSFIPTSAKLGDNVVRRSASMPWYEGSTLLHALESVPVVSDRNLIDLRFPVQLVVRHGEGERGYLGTPASGVVRPGDELVVLPSGVRTHVRAVFGPGGTSLAEGFVPQPLTLTLTEDVDVSRGDMLARPDNLPRVERTLDAMLVWMGDAPLAPSRPYFIKHCTRLVPATVERVLYRVDMDTLHRQDADTLAVNEVGRCVVRLARPIAHDAYRHNRTTGAFIVIDRVTHDTVGAGMILDRGAKARQATGGHVFPQAVGVGPGARAALNGHKGACVWLTGLPAAGKTTIAGALEEQLHARGVRTFVLDGDNLRSGLCADLGFSPEDRSENIRRAAAVAALMADAGLVVIAAFVSPADADRVAARAVLSAGRFFEVWVQCPLEVCEARDPKGLYRRARAGEMRDLTGVGAPYEEPPKPDLVVDTGASSSTPEDAARGMVAMLERAGVLIS